MARRIKKKKGERAGERGQQMSVITQLALFAFILFGILVIVFAKYIHDSEKRDKANIPDIPEPPDIPILENKISVCNLCGGEIPKECKGFDNMTQMDKVRHLADYGGYLDVNIAMNTLTMKMLVNKMDHAASETHKLRKSVNILITKLNGENHDQPN